VFWWVAPLFPQPVSGLPGRCWVMGAVCGSTAPVAWSTPPFVVCATA